MAGGLWSDVNAWDEAGREIASGIEDRAIGSNSVEYVPRDVWLIELTGGPGTECDTCTDYTYDDVVSKHWTALVGGVLKMTNRGVASYVGHSNGGRVALDAISNYNSIKNNVNYLSDGTSYTLPNTNPIINYIGVGVPGAFSTASLFTKNIDNGKGDKIIADFISQSKSHIRLAEIGTKLRTVPGRFISAINVFDQLKISKNMLGTYIYYGNSSLDQQPGIGVSITKAMLIYGTSDFDTTMDSDIIVPVSDVQAIYSNIISANKKIDTTSTTHIGQITDNQIKTKIKKRLNE